MGKTTRKGRSAVVLSPSDVAFVAIGSRPAQGERLRVGGRVQHVTPRVLLVADSVATISVALRGECPGDLMPGDLVEVDGALDRATLRDATLVATCDGRAPRFESEFGRLALGGVGHRLLSRSRALAAARAFFSEEGFVEVETPFRVPSPGLDAHVDAMKADGGWLITSPELHMKRLLVGGLPRIFQFARTTRAGELGDRHEPEFTMLEWYRAFSGMESLIADTEQLITRVVEALAGTLSIELPNGRRVSLRAPFPRLTVREAFRKFAGVTEVCDLARTDEARYFELFVDQVEPALSRLDRAIVLSEFPITQAALARPCADDPAVAERFEVYAAGLELCNGFGELTDPVEQRRRFEVELDRRRRTGAPLYPLDERFLAALEEGLPPSGGNALGFDRLVALALGTDRIADSMAFPSSHA